MKTENIAGERAFNFTLSQLVGWIIKRTDGSTVKHMLDGAEFAKTTVPVGVKQIGAGTYGSYNARGYQGLSSYCEHTPEPDKKLFQQDKLTLYVANSAGARKSTDPSRFDLIIDCGNVLTPPSQWHKSLLQGNTNRFDLLEEFEVLPATTPYVDYLKIDWVDRAAPKLLPAFWVKMTSILKDLAAKSPHDSFRVITACEGGHGRSGTAAVCLMMCMTDYDALDAITHLRAVHCPRAIESTVQHDYINMVAAMLGRTENAHEAAKVVNFRARLNEMTSKYAIPYHTKDTTETLKAEEVD